MFEWCKHHKDDPTPKQDKQETFKRDSSFEVSGRDSEFLQQFDQPNLLNLIMAANFLDIPVRNDILCYALKQHSVEITDFFSFMEILTFWQDDFRESNVFTKELFSRNISSAISQY